LDIEHFLSVQSDEFPFSPFGETGLFSAGQNKHFGLRMSIGHFSNFPNGNFLNPFRQFTFGMEKYFPDHPFCPITNVNLFYPFLLSLGQLLLFRQGPAN
jgi:hypothetical protein